MNTGEPRTGEEDVAESELTPAASDAVAESGATRKIVLFSATIAAAATVLYVTVVSQQTAIPSQVHVAWPLLAIVFALADSFAVHVEVRDNAHSFTMNELPLMIGLFLCTPEQLIAARVGRHAARPRHRAPPASAQGVLQHRAQPAGDGHRVDGVPLDHERDRPHERGRRVGRRDLRRGRDQPAAVRRDHDRHPPLGRLGLAGHGRPHGR